MDVLWNKRQKIGEQGEAVHLKLLKLRRLPSM